MNYHIILEVVPGLRDSFLRYDLSFPNEQAAWDWARTESRRLSPGGRVHSITSSEEEGE